MDLILFQFPQIANVHCVFTARGPGLSGNISFQADEFGALGTRQQLLERFQPLGLDGFAECRQVHGDSLLVEPAALPPNAIAMSCQPADGMMTEKIGLGLMIKTADCQPILIADAAGRHIMAIHVGWRGNRLNFPATAIAAFCKQYDLRPQELYAARGPSLGYAEFGDFENEWGTQFASFYDKKSKTVDLWQLSRSQLEKSGLLPERIYQLDICTLNNCSHFFSWRREKTLGRQAGIIWLSNLNGQTLKGR